MSIYSTIPHGDLFVNNKYTRWYFAIIDNALSKNRTKSKEEYFEAHHILPKSIYPKYKSLKENLWNGILLTAKEHFIVHLLLTKCFKYSKDQNLMGRAMHAMYKMRNHKISSGFYVRLKINMKHSDATKLKISIANSKPRGPNIKHIEYMRSSQNPHLGKPKSLEHKIKTSNSLKKKYLVTYPSGQTEVVFGLQDFCKVNKLSPGNMTSRENGSKGFKAILLI